MAFGFAAWTWIGDPDMNSFRGAVVEGSLIRVGSKERWDLWRPIDA